MVTTQLAANSDAGYRGHRGKQLHRLPAPEFIRCPTVILELPDELWQLMKIGVGGYVVGRSAEKIAEVKWGGHVEKTTMVKR